MFQDIAHEQIVETDARKELADLLYKNVNGVASLDLAMRIFKSEGPLELSDEDMAILRPFVEGGFTPAFIDSFNSNIINN
ncbi:MAG: hypothetical protein IK114_14265 [Fibrobacter sp.]|nr:hypothetical protein [Fibrobacter sp.]